MLLDLQGYCKHCVVPRVDLGRGVPLFVWHQPVHNAADTTLVHISDHRLGSGIGLGVAIHAILVGAIVAAQGDTAAVLSTVATLARHLHSAVSG